MAIRVYSGNAWAGLKRERLYRTGILSKDLSLLWRGGVSNRQRWRIVILARVYMVVCRKQSQNSVHQILDCLV